MIAKKTRIGEVVQAVLDRSGCDVGDDRRERDQWLELELAASQRESDRWRHGVPVEGDFVCPDSLRADALSERLHEAEAIVDYLSDAAVDALSGELSVMRAAYREKWGSK